MAYFPFFTDLTGGRGLIVGGGQTALGKAERLLAFGPSLTVVAPEVLPALADLPRVTVLRRAFRASDLDRSLTFVIAAADDRQVNRMVSAYCKARGIPVNVVDEPEDCTFLFPALVRQGPLTIGISTGGTSPNAAIWLKEQIAGLLPDSLGDILDWLGSQRPVVKARLEDPERRKQALARLFAWGLEKDGPLNEAETSAALAELLGEG